MGRFEDQLEKWSKQSPKVARFRDVEALLKYFGLHLENPKGSHWHLYHPDLENFQNSGGGGNIKILENTYTVPVDNGRTVKGRYVKVLVSFIKFLLEKKGGKESQE